jgi:hypothetical protein
MTSLAAMSEAVKVLDAINMHDGQASLMPVPLWRDMMRVRGMLVQAIVAEEDAQREVAK